MLKNKYCTMEIQDIVTVLRDRFKELGNTTKEEKAMAAKESGQGRVICFHCGKYGHKQNQCGNKKNGKPDVIPKKNGSGKGKY